MNSNALNPSVPLDREVVGGDELNLRAEVAGRCGESFVSGGEGLVEDHREEGTDLLS
jgi:hypothetical protein